jgi:flagellar hook assembly protein FlgD
VAGHATLGIYDARGRLVRNLLSGPVAAGSYAARWDGKTSSGVRAGLGVYFAALQTEAGQTVQKIVRMR